MVFPRHIILILCCILLLPATLYGTNVFVLQTDDVTVVFDEPLQKAARETAAVYPGVRSELEEMLGWGLDYKPAVHLIGDRKTFQEKAGSPFFTAFAVPRQRAIAIDHSRMTEHPSLLATTIKHELCHLILHNHIGGSTNLPRWLDEGVAQWVSGGMAEIIMDRERFILTRAVLSGRYFRLRDIVAHFPADERGLLTAYEESKDLIEYMVREYGATRILDVLGYLKEGKSPDRAVYQSIFISLDELEERWLKDLRGRATWFMYVSIHIYEILFFLAALLTVLGFIRMVIRKRNYRDDDVPDDA